MAGAAAVKIQEIDLSSVVAGFEGVYGAINVACKKGSISEATLVSNDRQFLDRYTPNGRVEVGYDLGYFSALAFLESSDKLWVKRVANQAYYAGLTLKEQSSIYNNYELASNAMLSDIESYTFDSGADVPAIAEESELTITDSSQLDGEVLLLEDDAGSVAFWFNVSGSTPIPAEASGADRAIEITSIDGSETPQDAAQEISTAISSDSEFNTSLLGAVVTIINAVGGARTDASLKLANGCSIATTVQGADAISVDDDAVFIYGINEGAHGNDIGIKTINYTDDEDLVKEDGAFLIQVFKRGFEGSPVETWLCSRQEGAKDGQGLNIYIEDVLKGSNYIRGINNPVVSGDYVKTQATVLYMNGGDDGLAVTDSNMIASAQVFANASELPVTILMDAGYTTPAYQIALDTIAKNRMDCVAILSTPYSKEISSNYLNDLIAYRKVDLNLNSSYSALFSPHVRITDRFNDRKIVVSPDGYCAGRISFSANQREIWFPPAGLRRGVLNVEDVVRRFNDGELDALYNVGINPIKFYAGRGIVVWGQKTLLSRRSALDRLNVRLLLIVIEPAIKEFLEDYLFEINDASTRAEVEQKIATYMEKIQAKRGVTEFQVICDTTNNTPQDIDNNRLIVDLFIKPSRSIEEIPFRVVILASGVSFSDAQSAI